MNWSYIAGYFDGEGHVGLHPNTRRQKSMITTLTWYNSHRASLEAMRDFMAVGRIGKGNGGNYEGSTKLVYGLCISRKLDIVYAIDHMLPDLLVKRDEVLKLKQHLLDHVDEKRAANFGVLLAIPKEDYIRWYIDEEQSLAEIAKRLNATPSGVLRLLRIHEIARREAGGFHLRGIRKSEQTKARMKAARQVMWQDPEFRAAQIANMQEGKRAGGFHQASGYTKPAIQGEKHPRSKLSDTQTEQIRIKYAAGGHSLNSLATEYHVSKKTILNIVQHKIRTHTLPTMPAS